VLKLKHLYTLISVSNLRSILESQGNYKEAKAIYQQALEIREKVLRPEHLNTLNSISNLRLVLKS